MTSDPAKDLIRQRYFALQLHVLRAMRAGELMAEPKIWAARSVARTDDRYSVRGNDSVTVIPIMGLITHRGIWFGTSIEMIRGMLRRAIADKSLGAIVLEIDSPGGSVSGIAELAREIYDARAAKPVIAVANCQCASAAYYLASQAGEIYVTPSGVIGSIGVYGMHEDWSRALDQMGITITLISAGEGKVDGNPFEPLTDEVLAEIQKDVDRNYREFVAAVARGRDVSDRMVEKYWRAKTYSPQEAVEIRMADAVGTIDEAIGQAARYARQRARTAADVDFEVRARKRRRL